MIEFIEALIVLEQELKTININIMDNNNKKGKLTEKQKDISLVTDEPLQTAEPVQTEVHVEGLKKIFTLADINALSNSPKGKYAFSEFFANYFLKLGVKEKIDNTELNIIADFHYYNLQFAKEQLLLQSPKITLLLNIFAMLIAFKDFESQNLMLKTITEGEAKPEPKSEEEEYKAALEQKYDSFRDALMAYSLDNAPFAIKTFTMDEIK